MDKILKNQAPEGRQNRFGMKLYPFHAIFPVPQPHDLPFLCPSAYLEAFRQPLSIDNQRVVPGRLKGIGQTIINGLTVMKNRRGLAMSDPFSPDHLATKGMPNGLMS